LPAVIERANLLSSVYETKELEQVVAAHTRINRLVKNHLSEQSAADVVLNASSGDILNTIEVPEKIRLKKDILHKDTTHMIQTNLIQSDIEDNLYRYTMGMASKQVISLEAIYEMLVAFIPIIDKFFEDVMVMDENILIRNNRLRILEEVDKQFMRVANFTKLLK